MKRIVILLLIAGIFGSAYAQNREELALQGRKAYESGQFANAVAAYEKIVKQGYESAQLYYNLGNAYFRTNDLPSAILYYEKALKLDPTQEDIRYNLNIANSRIIDKVELVPEMFYKRWWKALLNFLSLDVLAVILIGILSLALLSTAVYLTSKHLSVRKSFFWTGFSLFILGFIVLIAAEQKQHFLQNNHEAIVFIPTVTVKSSPDSGSTDLFVIHEGLKVTLMDKIGEWQEIRIANGSVGWLKISSLRMI